jgi:hypothetical protein
MTTPKMRVCLLASVAILLSSSCTDGPSEAELVARFLTEYGESVPETIRLDPRRVLEPDSLAEAAPSQEEVFRDAARLAGLEEGNGQQAWDCARYVSSLGVPEVVERVVLGLEGPPEGCDPDYPAIFVLRIDPARDSLHLEGRGWSWEWSYHFSGAVARDGSGSRIGETSRGPNPW